MPKFWQDWYDKFYLHAPAASIGCDAGLAPGIDRTMRKPRLAADIEQTIRAGILAGEPAVGEKLATERALCQQYGVSRTVIREAIAGLRAAGLVESRRGSGLYVLSDRAFSMFGQVSMDERQSEVVEVIDILELRATVEAEAAALAANRASSVQLATLARQHRQFEDAVRSGSATASSDFAFHLSIAEATNNRAYRAFMTQMGQQTIPRDRLDLDVRGDSGQAYLQTLQQEHEAIFTAIEQRQPEVARAAMRRHLLDSLARYRELVKA